MRASIAGHIRCGVFQWMRCSADTKGISVREAVYDEQSKILEVWFVTLHNCHDEVLYFHWSSAAAMGK